MVALGRERVMIDLLSALALVAAAGPTSATAVGTVPQAATSASVRRKHRRRGSVPIPTRGKLPEWSIDGRVGVVSDYRPGGISSTNGKPALQAEFNLTHRSGGSRAPSPATWHATAGRGSKSTPARVIVSGAARRR